MNTQFNECEIILGRLSNNKTAPILIIKSKNTLFGLRLYKYNPKHEVTFPSKKEKIKKQNFKKKKDNIEIIIDQSEGLKFKSVVDIKQKVSLNKVEKIKVLCRLEKTKYQTIITTHNAFLREEYQASINSHKKRKNQNYDLEISIINNEKYDLKVKRGGKRRGTRRSLDYIEPIHTPYITVYRF